MTVAPEDCIYQHIANARIMQLRLTVAGFILGICLTAPLLGQPQDMTIEAYKRFQKDVVNQIAERMKTEFERAENEIKQLSDPYRVGEEVSVRVRQGKRERMVAGKFRGIVGSQARIGERKVLLSDIVEMDRNRLFYGVNADMLLR